MDSLYELNHFWFQNSHLWFDASEEDDQMIYDKYYIHFHHYFTQNNDFTLIEDNKQLTLAFILLYDQIGRHICRICKSDHMPYFNRAYVIAKIVIENKEFLESYTPEERVFILLVYRHTFDKSHIENVIEIVQEWRVIENLSIYRRFYQASLQSLAKINNQQDLSYIVDFLLPSVQKSDVESDYLNPTMNSVLDDKLSPKMDEVLSFDMKIEEIYEEPVFKIFESSMIQSLDQLKLDHRQIGASVSGGVDSMVCTLLLYVFSHKYGYNPTVFSVNYGNRFEQNIEIFMVNKYLDFLYTVFDNTTKHYVRKITEMKRTQDHDRDIYEEFTRNIRFQCYKIVAPNVPFILGHNRDDSLENVISNIKKERSYQNLFGMAPIGVEKDVTLLRPLLSVWKRDIIAFAQKYKIPFVYDSTPSWSERGQMRDVLFPFLNQFDSRILDGLFSLASNFKEIYKVYDSSLPNIQFDSDQCIVENKEIYFEDYMKRIIRKVVQHYGLHPIRNKAIHHLSQTLHYVSTHKITLSKQLYCMKNDQILIFYIKK